MQGLANKDEFHFLEHSGDPSFSIFQRHSKLVSHLFDAYSLESALDAWEVQVSDSWKYQTCISLKSPTGTRHCYRGMVLAAAWNTYRSARILLCQTILNACAQFDSTPFFPTALEAHACSTIWQKAGDICAGVQSWSPASVRDVTTTSDPLCGEATTSSVDFEEKRAFQGYSPLWPLY